MRRKFPYRAGVITSAGLFLLILSAAAPGIAEAYSTPIAPNFQGILAPFENFFHSIGSIGTIPLPTPAVNPPSVPQNPVITNFIRDLFQKFDAWLYGVTGFHIAGIFTAILNVFSWVLGVVKGVVDWLLQALR